MPAWPARYGLIVGMPYPADGARFYGEHVSNFAIWQARQIAGRVLTGVTAGDNLDTIVASVIGTPEMRYSDGVWTDKQKREQVKTLVRTAVNHAAAVTREETYEENRDLVKGVQIVAT